MDGNVPLVHRDLDLIPQRHKYRHFFFSSVSDMLHVFRIDSSDSYLTHLNITSTINRKHHKVRTGRLILEEALVTSHLARELKD